MNKLPAKQIYLLSIIVIGIITLSVYSTYAIFTLESETSDIVNLETANALNVRTNTYEYKQIKVPANKNVSTDVDIYNNYDYDICYSIWYKVVPTTGISPNVVAVYQNTSETLTTSGTLTPVTSKRVNIIINNKNDKEVKVNIGISYSKNEGTCELNISEDKKLISSTMDDTKILSDIIIKDKEEKNSKSNYITYSYNKKITLDNTKLKVSKNYTYNNEIFTLTDPIEINYDEITNYESTNDIKYYTCLSDNECRHLYRIKKTLKEDDKYKITEYDIMIGYLQGTSGIRKVDNNYYYYGDNPNNFVYYNCPSQTSTENCELWRIIGVFQDDNKYITKIIKNDFIDSVDYGNISWKDSKVLTKLKEYKINDESMIKEVNYKIENLIDNKITSLNETYKSNIMLMNLSDYINTSICHDKKISEFDTNCLNNNWLNYNIEEWTMTIKYIAPYTDEETGERVEPLNNTVYSIGNSIKDSIVTSNLNIRPVVYLKDTTILIDGNGTYEKPYVIR